jgi:hypothetical protein
MSGSLDSVDEERPQPGRKFAMQAPDRNWQGAAAHACRILVMMLVAWISAAAVGDLETRIEEVKATFKRQVMNGLTIVEPGDVIELKRKIAKSTDRPASLNEASLLQ